MVGGTNEGRSKLLNQIIIIVHDVPRRQQRQEEMKHAMKPVYFRERHESRVQRRRIHASCASRAVTWERRPFLFPCVQQKRRQFVVA